MGIGGAARRIVRMWMMVLIGPSMFYSAYNIVDKWNSHLLSIY